MEEGVLMGALFETMMVPCRMIERRRKPDGQGGTKTEWTDGAKFDAAIVKDTTLAAVTAEKQGVTAVYTVTTRPGIGLDFHEVFKRLSDGAVFRVTADHKDSEPPKEATFKFEQVRAERWELT